MNTFRFTGQPPVSGVRQRPFFMMPPQLSAPTTAPQSFMAAPPSLMWTPSLDNSVVIVQPPPNHIIRPFPNSFSAPPPPQLLPQTPPSLYTPVTVGAKADCVPRTVFQPGLAFPVSSSTSEWSTQSAAKKSNSSHAPVAVTVSARDGSPPDCAFPVYSSTSEWFTRSAAKSTTSSHAPVTVSAKGDCSLRPPDWAFPVSSSTSKSSTQSALKNTNSSHLVRQPVLKPCKRNMWITASTDAELSQSTKNTVKIDSKPHHQPNFVDFCPTTSLSSEEKNRVVSTCCVTCVSSAFNSSDSVFSADQKAHAAGSAVSRKPVPSDKFTAAISTPLSSLSITAASFVPTKVDGSHRLPAPGNWKCSTDVTGTVKGHESGSEVGGTPESMKKADISQSCEPFQESTTSLYSTASSSLSSSPPTQPHVASSDGTSAQPMGRGRRLLQTLKGDVDRKSTGPTVGGLSIALSACTFFCLFHAYHTLLLVGFGNCVFFVSIPYPFLGRTS